MTPRRWLWAALLVGGLLRLGAVWLYRDVPLSAGGDDRQYHAVAQSLRGGDGFRLDGAWTAYRAPLYPLFIAAVQAKAGTTTPAPVRRAQAGLGLLLILGVYFFAARLYAPAAGAWAAWFCALHPALILLPTSLYLEALYAPLVLLVAWRLAAWHRRPGRRELAYLGLAVGLSLCARSFLGLLPLAVVIVRIGRAAPRRWCADAGLLALCCALPLLPWTARNALRFSRLIPAESGVAGPVWFYAAEGFTYAPADEAGPEPMRTMYATLHHTEWDAYAGALAARRIAADPAAYARSTARRVWALWSDAYTPYLLHDHPRWAGVMERKGNWVAARAVERVVRGLLILLAAAALLLRPVWTLAPTAGVAAYFTLYALGTVFPRFLTPAAPLLCVLAGVGAAALARRQRK